MFMGPKYLVNHIEILQENIIYTCVELEYALKIIQNIIKEMDMSHILYYIANAEFVSRMFTFKETVIARQWSCWGYWVWNQLR